MDPLENLICSVIQAHPEYHPTLDDPDVLNQDFAGGLGEQNPFMHMGLHIAVLEQVSTDRPPGITSLYRAMLGKYRDEHALQHQVMACLEEALWRAREEGGVPDEQAYLDSIGKIK
jgi:hypothetical protein